jgi:hypothetical protein
MYQAKGDELDASLQLLRKYLDDAEMHLDSPYEEAEKEESVKQLLARMRLINMQHVKNVVMEKHRGRPCKAGSLLAHITGSFVDEVNNSVRYCSLKQVQSAYQRHEDCEDNVYHVKMCGKSSMLVSHNRAEGSNVAYIFCKGASANSFSGLTSAQKDKLVEEGITDVHIYVVDDTNSTVETEDKYHHVTSCKIQGIKTKPSFSNTPLRKFNATSTTHSHGRSNSSGLGGVLITIFIIIVIVLLALWLFNRGGKTNTRLF